jgi:hypothetical protein
MLGLMHAFAVLPSGMLAIALTSCATITVDGHRAYGHVHDVSVADIHAALTADRVQTTWWDKTVYDIEVLSSTEMRLYHRPSTENPSHDVLKRVGGTWRVVDTHVILNGR